MGKKMLDNLLNELLTVCKKSDISRMEIIESIKNLLEWLFENNTDENCKKIDAFVFEELIHKEFEQNLPKDLYEILWDMGGSLHDTHSAPKVAKNFYSTPEQLLERLNHVL